MADVFISYARPDRPLAEALAKDLMAQGVSVWWDAELLGSDDFQEVILSALSQAKAAIVIWSKASTKSRFVMDEARYALHYEKLIATRDPNLEIIDIPFGFQSQHTESIQNRRNILRALSKLGVVFQPPRARTDDRWRWDQLQRSRDPEEYLAFIAETNDPGQRKWAAQRLRQLFSAHDLQPRYSQSVKKIASTDRVSAFLSGLALHVPRFQLTVNAFWTSVGVSVVYFFGFCILAIAAATFVGITHEVTGSPGFVIFVITIILFGMTYLTYSGMRRFLKQKLFFAGVIQLPFFVLSSAAAFALILADVCGLLGIASSVGWESFLLVSFFVGFVGSFGWAIGEIITAR